MSTIPAENRPAFSFLLAVRLTVCRALYWPEDVDFQTPLGELVNRLHLEEVSRATWPEECGPDPLTPLWDGTIRDRSEEHAQVCEVFNTIAPVCLATSGDRFARQHHQIFVRKTRHPLGEYYTPDWMAEYVCHFVSGGACPRVSSATSFTPNKWDLFSAGTSPAANFDAEAKRRIESAAANKGFGRMLDPACGSGVFLVEGIRRLREVLGEDADRRTVLQKIFDRVVGIDINPVAVAAARANYLLAIADLLDPASLPCVPVWCGDSITGERLDDDRPSLATPFDTLVGNPPWIAWDNLSQEIRDRTEPFWRKYGLFTLSGNEARHGGGKKDLSMLMLYAAADRFLRPGGRLGFVIAQTLFQTRGAGDGFRRFQIGEDGPRLGVFHVDDMVGFKPFPGAANWTAIVFLEKGAETVFPVSYCKWSKRAGGGDKRKDASTKMLDGFDRRPCLARPIDPERPRSPWLVLPEAEIDTPIAVGPSDYEAHLGVNTGGANGVYWLTVLGPGSKPETVLVENQPGRGKRAVEPFRGEIEAGLLYPLVRWSDLGRWSAVPSTHVLLVQDTERRVGLDEESLRRDFPLTHAYLERYRELLVSRSAYRRYQNRGPFYSMYNVGSYSVAPYRVVWRRMDRRMNAAVVEPIDDPILGRRPVLIQETCVQIATETLAEAHYLCALLNSSPIGAVVSAHSVDGGKSFGSPGMLEYLGLRRYEAEKEEHRELVVRSKEKHKK
ncbi:MAG: N-6 DNA methylase [Planctomycetia bacterium]|jgi:hypothetical protein